MPTGRPFCGLSGMRALKILSRHIPQSHASHWRTAWAVACTGKRERSQVLEKSTVHNRDPTNLRD